MIKINYTYLKNANHKYFPFHAKHEAWHLLHPSSSPILSCFSQLITFSIITTPAGVTLQVLHCAAVLSAALPVKTHV